MGEFVEMEDFNIFDIFDSFIAGKEIKNNS
jgi:hypothetical protein